MALLALLGLPHRRTIIKITQETAEPVDHGRIKTTGIAGGMRKAPKRGPGVWPFLRGVFANATQHLRRKIISSKFPKIPELKNRDLL